MSDVIRGLPADPSLGSVLEEAEKHEIGVLIFQIKNDRFVKTCEVPGKSSIEENFAVAASKLDSNPCFVFLREAVDRWFCLVYLPDQASQKRLYAASTQALTASIGKVKAEGYANCKDQCSMRAFSQKNYQETPPDRPLLAASECSVGARPALPDVECAFDEAVTQALDAFKLSPSGTIMVHLPPTDPLRFSLLHVGQALEEAVAELTACSSPILLVLALKEERAHCTVLVHFIPELSTSADKLRLAVCKRVFREALGDRTVINVEFWKLSQLTLPRILEEVHPRALPAPPLPKKPKRHKNREEKPHLAKFSGVVKP